MARRSLATDHAAVHDFIQVWLFTCEHWGADQADRYVDRLVAGSELLRAFPHLGKSRDELREGYFSHQVEQHILFYTFTSNEVRIRRVLHQAMDLPSHLGD